ncbi:MAG: DUF2207 domain-containing protein [Desulfovibrio sp.]|nr:DUF2207 domain-containing protein [Desulfovibrio sp.]
MAGFYACGMWKESRTPAPVQILSLDVTIELHRENRVTATELITVAVPQKGRHAGILRTLSVANPSALRREDAPFLEVREALLDGAPCRTALSSTFRSQNVAVFLMPERGGRLEPGEHCFRLVYDMTGMVAFGEASDSIVWNAAGTESEWPIARPSCTVVPAEGAPLAGSKASLGCDNAEDPPVSFAEAERNGQTCFVFTAKNPVFPSQDFTIEAALPKGAVPEPAPCRPEEDAAFTILCAGALLFTLAYCCLLWWNWGRDPKPCPVIPVCEPPLLPEPWGSKGEPLRLSPAQTQYLANDCLPDSSGLAALFLSLHRKGWCRLSGSAEEGFRATRLQPSAKALEPLSPEEQAAWAIMPRTLEFKEESADALEEVTSACAQQLDQLFGTLFQKAFFLRLLCFAVPIPALMGVSLCHSPMGRIYGPAWPSSAGNALLLFGIFLVWSALLPLFGPRQKHMEDSREWFRVPAQMLLFLIGIGCTLFPHATLSTLSSPVEALLPNASPLQTACFFAGLALPFLCAPFLQARTRRLVELQAGIQGLAMYIGDATARAGMADPPEENHALFERLLPYASALDCRNEWVKRFAGHAEDGMRGGAQKEPLLAGFRTAGFFNAVHDCYPDSDRDKWEKLGTLLRFLRHFRFS